VAGLRRFAFRQGGGQPRNPGGPAAIGDRRGPGAQEDVSAGPFVGPLRPAASIRCWRACRLNTIVEPTSANAWKCMPPENRKPDAGRDGGLPALAA